MENLEPKRDVRSPISSLEFQRKSDYKKFRNFIKKETKELKGITEPKDDKIKNILKVGVGGLGLLALGGIIGAIKGKDNEDISGKFETPFIVGRRNPDDLSDPPKIPDLPDLAFSDSIADRSRIPKPVKKKIKVSKPVKTKVKNPVKKNINVPEKSLVGGGDTRRQGPGGQDVGGTSGGTGDRSTSGKIKGNKINIDKIFEKGKNINKKLSQEGFNPNTMISDKTLEFLKKSGKVFINTDGIPLYLNSDNVFTRFGNLPFKDKTYYVSIQKAFESLEKTPDLKSAEEILKNKKPEVKITDTSRFSKLKSRGSKTFDTLSKTTQKLTPEFLKSDLAKPLLKSKVKSGFFVIDLIFAGQAFADLFKPKDNLRTAVVDLFNAYNNLKYKDDPSKLKYYITESSDERIRAYHIQKNKEIRMLKEKAGVDLGGPQNILIVPENKQNNQVSTNVPITKGADKISFVPFEPVNSVGTDILLHKLNQ